MTVLRLPSARTVPGYLIVAAGSLVVLGSITTYMVIRPGVPSAAVPTATVQWGTVRPFISATGSIGNNVAVDVSSSTGGQIVKWLVREGSTVKGGQPIGYFADYTNSVQMYQAVKSELAAAQGLEQNASSLQAAEARSLGSASQIAEDQVAVHLAFAQWSSATQAALDAANHLAATSEAVIQSAKDTLDQATAQVSINQGELTQAQTKLANDEQPQASQATIQQDQSNANIIQQELDNATSQYNVDETIPGVSPSLLQQDQNNISALQAQLTAAQGALSLAESVPQSKYVIQQDIAAVTTAQDQLTGAQTVASDDEQIYRDALASTSAQIGLAGARSEESTVSALQNKLFDDKSAGASAVVLAQDQSSLESTIRWVQLQVTLYAQAQQGLVETASPAQVTDALASLDQAVGAMEVDYASLQTAKLQLVTDAAPAGKRALLQLQQTVLQNRETVQQAQQALLTAEANLQRSELRAPVSGVVTALAVSAGTRVAPDQSAATILPVGANEQVVALVDAAQVDEVHKGESVRILSPDFSGIGTGKVAFVSPLPLPSSQGGSFQYPVYIDVTRLPKAGGSGMVVTCQISTAIRRHVPVVPADAVMTNGGELGLYVKKSGRFTFQKVSLGASDQKYVQVKNIPVGTTVALQKPGG